MSDFVPDTGSPLGDMWVRLTDLGQSAGRGASGLALALVAVVVAWWLATLAGALTRSLLRVLRFDGAVRKLTGEVSDGGRRSASMLAGWAVHWGVLAFGVLFALDLMGFAVSPAVAARLSDILPRIVAAGFLFTAGLLLALFAGALARRFLESIDVGGARFQGQVVTVVMSGFSLLVALEQLGFAAQFVMWIAIVAAGAAGLALALAFGLGCRELARDFIVEYLRSLDHDQPRRPS